MLPVTFENFYLSQCITDNINIFKVTLSNYPFKNDIQIYRSTFSAPT